MHCSDGPVFGRVTTAVALLLAISLGTGIARAATEPPPTLRASEVISDDLRVGDHHRVAEAVVNDGILNTYTIESDFGTFIATGTAQLRVRVREMSALAELSEIEKSDVFVDAAKEAALGQVKAIGTFVEQPAETIKGVPGGVGRWIKKTSRQAGDLIDEGKDHLDDDGDDESGEDGVTTDEALEAGQKLTKKYFGVSSAHRRWAEKLGVDPYTSNEVLFDAIEQVARVDAAARFGVKLAPIPTIPGANYISTLNSLVWSKDPYELLDLNTGKLRSMGVDDATIEAFFDTPWYSPSLQTMLVGALEQLGDTKNRGSVVSRASSAESQLEATFFTLSVTALAWVDEHEIELVEILDGEGLPVARGPRGEAVLVAAADHVAWTDDLAATITARFGDRVTAGDAGAYLWISGGVSDLARARLTDVGWSVHPGLSDRFDPAL